MSRLHIRKQQKVVLLSRARKINGRGHGTRAQVPGLPSRELAAGRRCSHLCWRQPKQRSRKKSIGFSLPPKSSILSGTPVDRV
jgi:hypothetical protein